MKRNLGSVRQSLLHVGVASSVLLTSGLATMGCLDRELRPLVPCVSQGFVESVAQNAVDKVDLLEHARIRKMSSSSACPRERGRAARQ